MAVPVVNLSIDKGVDFSTNIKLKKDGAPLDVTGYSFSGKIRKHYGASTYYPLNVSASPPYDLGVVKIGVASTVSSTMPVGRYVYDVLFSYTLGITTVTVKAVEGTVIVKGTAS